MDVNTGDFRGKKIGDVLMAMGVIDARQLSMALAHAAEWDHPLGKSLVALGFCTEEAVVRARSLKFGIPSIRLGAFTPPESARTVVDASMALELQVLPLAVTPRNGRSVLQLAMSNPEALDCIMSVEFATNMAVEVILAGDDDLAAAIQRVYGDNFDYLPMMDGHFLPTT